MLESKNDKYQVCAQATVLDLSQSFVKPKKKVNDINYVPENPSISALKFRIKNEGVRKDSLHGQATCNSRVGPLMSSEKDFVGGGANRSYYHPLRKQSQSGKYMKESFMCKKNNIFSMCIQRYLMFI